MSILAMMWAMVVCAQTASQNYVLSQTMLDESGAKCIEQISYFDGLGRLSETVGKGVTPNGADLVTLTEYDGLTREVRSWLPIAYSGRGAYVSPSTVQSTACSSALYGGDSYPYSEKFYEKTAIDQVIEQYGPGRAWRSAKSSVTSELLTNQSSGELACLRYSVSGSDLRCNGTYPKLLMSIVFAPQCSIFAII
jgi:hypothetical protein